MTVGANSVSLSAMTDQGTVKYRERWPKNRDRKTFAESLSETQRLKLICGIGGCRRSFQGRFDHVMTKRDAHRREVHPDWTPPSPRGRRRR